MFISACAFVVASFQSLLTAPYHDEIRSKD